MLLTLIEFIDWKATSKETKTINPPKVHLGDAKGVIGRFKVLDNCVLVL
jgi:hypothetical protein